MEEYTLYSLWQMVISRKNISTALSYKEAFNRFQKDNGMQVTFEDITPQFIDHWKETMYHHKLSKTTINIYLRSFSAMLNIAYEYQLLKQQPRFLFRGLGIFSHNSSNSRKHCYLPIADWARLWTFFEQEGAGYSTIVKWTDEQRKRNLEALGLMLFMYLANGMNLRDVCMLRYDRFYFQKGGAQLQFSRHKTSARTGVTVEIPILRELRIIIERLGQKPCEGKLIFPYFNQVIGDSLREHKKAANLGHLVRDRMHYVAKALQLHCEPTPTWARHSFATNLIQAGVPKDYVMWAMAHVSTDVTSRYIASYSYDQMVSYNTLLLYGQNSHEHILAQIKHLSSEEQQKLFESFSALLVR